MFHKEGRRIGTVFLKCLHKTPPGIFINGSILEEMFANYPAVYKACRGNKFHIHLYTLPRMIHLLIRFWNIFGVRRVDRHNALFFEEAVESSKGAGITTPLDGTVKAPFSSIDVLLVRFIFDGGFRNPIFLSVINK